MSALPLDWHQECFRNWTTSLRRKRAEVARLTAELERAEKELADYAEQIATATARGMSKFDRDRFLVKRKAQG